MVEQMDRKVMPLVGLIALLIILLAATPGAAHPAVPALATHSTVNAATAPAISRNWSGYAATHGTFTSVTGTWTVPHISSSGHSAADATWVGIGGLNSSDLIQSGTQDLVSASGQVTSVAFLEMLPNVAQAIPVSVSSGDSITVSVTARGGNRWRITFQDTTTGQSYTTTVAYASSFSSAEWIEEAPSNGHTILPLAKFGVVHFSGCATKENGSSVGIVQSSAQAIVMVNKNNRVLATPSSPGSSGASFSVTRSKVAA